MKKTYIINVFREVVEQVEVSAENALEAKNKAYEEASSLNHKMGYVEWLEISDTEVDSVDGVKTYGEDEPNE